MIKWNIYTFIPGNGMIHNKYEKFIPDKISYSDNLRAKVIWQKSCCKNSQDYHDLYLKIDVLLLADIF